jgi:hypothetical protein
MCAHSRIIGSKLRTINFGDDVSERANEGRCTLYGFSAHSFKARTSRVMACALRVTVDACANVRSVVGLVCTTQRMIELIAVIK